MRENIVQTKCQPIGAERSTANSVSLLHRTNFTSIINRLVSFFLFSHTPNHNKQNINFTYVSIGLYTVSVWCHQSNSFLVVVPSTVLLRLNNWLNQLSAINRGNCIAQYRIEIGQCVRWCDANAVKIERVLFDDSIEKINSKEIEHMRRRRRKDMQSDFQRANLMWQSKEENKQEKNQFRRKLCEFAEKTETN